MKESKRKWMAYRLRRWTAGVDWSTLATSRHDLERANAFVDAEDRGLQLLDPATVLPVPRLI
jgi:hypothetical protein